MYHKQESRRITVAEMAPHIHSFGVDENKVDKISKWLIDWIKISIKNGKVKPYDFLPAKGDLAFHIGVSQGTIQNVFRRVEDMGFVESKQRIGTYIKNPEARQIEKLTSKRELAAEIIKKHILDGAYKVGDILCSTRKLSLMYSISPATIRIAISSLVLEGILEKINNSFVISNIDFVLSGDIEVKTLVDKVAKELQEYVKKNFPKGSKLPSNAHLAKLFNVSVKTIHDSIKILSREGILQSRRGQYGTTVVNDNEKSSLYHYEKIELKLRHYISLNCEIGSKLPSIKSLSEEYQVSPKTIKKALDNLSEDGYITFSRGRYGGTFVTDIPQGTQEAYKWLALSSDYVSNT